MTPILTKKLNKIITEAKEIWKISLMYLPSKKLSEFNRLVDMVDKLIENINNKNNNVNDIISIMSKKYNDYKNEDDKKNIEKFVSKIKNNVDYNLLAKNFIGNEKLENFHNALKYYFILARNFKVLKKINNKRNLFKIDNELIELENKIKEIKENLIEIINGKIPVKIVKLKRSKLTKKNHIIPTSYYQKWINKKNPSRNDFLSINANISAIVKKSLDNPQKLNKFSIYFLNFISKYSKKYQIELNSIKLDNFMFKENFIDQELENIFTKFEHNGVCFSTEKIDFLEHIYKDVENKKIDFFLHINNSKVIDCEIKGQFENKSHDYNLESKIKILNNLNFSDLPFIQLKIFIKFFSSRVILANYCFTEKITKDKELNYNFEYINNLTVLYTFQMLKNIKKTPEKFKHTIENLSILVGKTSKEPLDLIIEATNTFIFDYYLKIKSKEKKLEKNYIKKINQLKNFTKSKELKSEINDIVNIKNKFKLKNEINNLKNKLIHKKANLIFSEIESIINLSIDYENINTPWLDSELSSFIHTAFFKDLISDTENYIIDNYLIISTNGRKLPTSTKPIVVKKIYNHIVIFVAYTPDILIINTNNKVILKFKNLIKNGEKYKIFDYYENYIRNNSRILIEYK